MDQVERLAEEVDLDLDLDLKEADLDEAAAPPSADAGSERDNRRTARR